jgi:hypothetical protein
MVEIPRMSWTCHGLEKNAGSCLTRGPERHLPVGAMEVLFRLKSDYIPPAILGKTAMHVCRVKSQFLKIIVERKMEALKSPPNVPRPYFFIKTPDARVLFRIICAKDRVCFSFFVRLPEIAYREHRKHETFSVSEGHGLPCFKGPGHGVAYVKADGNWPESAIAKTHPGYDAFVVFPVKVAAKGIKGAVEKEFKIAKLRCVKKDGWIIKGCFFQALDAPEMNQQAF